MEDIAKIEATIVSLESKDANDWLVVPLFIEKIDTKNKVVDEIKVFVCADTGEVKEYPYSNFVK